MNAWSNIQNFSQDSEIIKINNFEKRLGKLPDKVSKIRELITRFEVCHFKYQLHLRKIKDSINVLEPSVDTTTIGINHIQHGEIVLNKDTTGKSLIGMQYVWALNEWLGDKSKDKIRLVRLLLARLTWDWIPYEELQRGGDYKDLEFQICRMDICHYAFPNNLDLLIKGIGQMKAIEDKIFEGCGSYNTGIKAYLENEFSDLNNAIKSFGNNNGSNKNDLIKIWLTACLAKTIKENIHISLPIAEIEN